MLLQAMESVISFGNGIGWVLAGTLICSAVFLGTCCLFWHSPVESRLVALLLASLAEELDSTSARAGNGWRGSFRLSGFPPGAYFLRPSASYYALLLLLLLTICLIPSSVVVTFR